MFATAGNVVTLRRENLLLTNVEMLVFLNKNINMLDVIITQHFAGVCVCVCVRAHAINSAPLTFPHLMLVLCF
jgi:hypothetical protein